MRVQVLDYDPNWAQLFVQIRDKLELALADVSYLSIEHVGSTSVPGLPAKPIIDIDIIIHPPHLSSIIIALTTRGGYTYMGEWGIPGRHAFRKVDATPRRNLYVCIEGCLALRNHLAVRDLCRMNAEVRGRYAALKQELATREWRNVDDYCEAKTELICWMLQKAGISLVEAREIEEVNRQAAVAGS